MVVSPSQRFSKAWAAAREDSSAGGHKVTYAELQLALLSLRSDALTNRRAQRRVADTMAEEPVMTGPARREAREYLHFVGNDAPMDAATVSAIKADYVLRALAPYNVGVMPERVGRLVSSSLDLPAAVQEASEETENDLGLEWETTDVRKAMLAGHPVFIVRHEGEDAFQIQLFSSNGRKLAVGTVDDPMAAPSWTP